MEQYILEINSVELIPKFMFTSKIIDYFIPKT